MITSQDWTFAGSRGSVTARAWRDDDAAPRYVVLLAHGYGEHIRRYEHVAAALVADGAAVYGPDHIGHGRSDGERVLIDDYDDVLADLSVVHERAVAEHPTLPVVLIGHSMGGMIAARYAQLHGDELTAVVLSGPVIGEFALLDVLLAPDGDLDVAIDVATLSRDDAVGAAYAADPLVWHGPFKRPTVEAMAATVAAIDAGGSLGALPMMWIHGAEDALVPIDGSRPGVERVRGDVHVEHVYEGARHEVFNETNGAEVLADVIAFIHRVLDTAPAAH